MTFRALLSPILALTLATVLIAPSAGALSCLRSDLVSDLNEAKASETTYYLLVGQFSAPRIDRGTFKPQTMGQHSSSRTQSVRGTFTGVSLGTDPRFDGTLNAMPVTVTTTCAASWCGVVPPADRKMIAFVEVVDGQSPVLKVGPCPSKLYDYTPERVSTLRRCLDKDCATFNPYR